MGAPQYNKPVLSNLHSIQEDHQEQNKLENKSGPSHIRVNSNWSSTPYSPTVAQ